MAKKAKKTSMYCAVTTNEIGYRRGWCFSAKRKARNYCKKLRAKGAARCHVERQRKGRHWGSRG